MCSSGDALHSRIGSCWWSLPTSLPMLVATSGNFDSLRDKCTFVLFFLLGEVKRGTHCIHGRDLISLCLGTCLQLQYPKVVARWASLRYGTAIPALVCFALLCFARQTRDGQGTQTHCPIPHCPPARPSICPPCAMCKVERSPRQSGHGEVEVG